MKSLRMAVVGVGALGQHHARILASLPGVSLVGVVDTRPERAAEVAARHGTTPYVRAIDVLDAVDAVTVAVPTLAHVEVALPFLERGVAVLLEKPLAATVEEADRVVAAATRHGAVLAAGHTERFNPAVAAALPLVSRPRFIEIHRLGAFPERSLDIDVVFDVMIHDLDLLLACVGSDVVSVEAVGVNVLTPKTDIANARIRFASGCIANVTASRISRERIRKARFFQQESYISIDYAAREVEVYRLVPGAGRPAIEGGRIAVPDEEPLLRELRDFVEAVRDGRTPGVTGAAGRDALALAARVAGAMNTGEAPTSRPQPQGTV